MFIPSRWGVGALHLSSSSRSPKPSKTTSSELHLVYFDKLPDALTLFIPSDFASAFYVSFFRFYLPGRFTVVFPPSCSFGAFVAGQSIFRDSKMSATRTVVSNEILNLSSNTKDFFPA